jgi:hypothetical protein
MAEIFFIYVIQKWLFQTSTLAGLPVEEGENQAIENMKM